MASKRVQEERVSRLNEVGPRCGDYVLYWMQQSQRASDNHALEYAVGRANDLGQRLVVAFGLADDYPEANARHYAFMLEGLRDVEDALRERGIKFVVRKGSPDEVTLDLAPDASEVVADGAYLRPERAWKRRVADEAG